MKNIYSQIIKAIIIFISIIFSTTGLHSQNKIINFYATCSSFSDFGRTPVFSKNYVSQSSAGNTYYKFYSKTNYFSLMNIGLNSRIKIKELNQHSELSFNAGISIGLTGAFDISLIRNFLNTPSAFNSIDDEGISMFKLNLPMYLSIGYGLTSKNQKDKKFGVSFGLGAEVNKVPVLVPFALIMNEDPRITSFWIQPIGVIKLSLLSPGNTLYRISITGGLGEPLDYPILGSGYYKVEDLDGILTTRRAFSLNVAFEIPLNF